MLLLLPDIKLRRSQPWRDVPRWIVKASGTMAQVWRNAYGNRMKAERAETAWLKPKVRAYLSR